MAYASIFFFEKMHPKKSKITPTKSIANTEYPPQNTELLYIKNTLEEIVVHYVDSLLSTKKSNFTNIYIKWAVFLAKMKT